MVAPPRAYRSSGNYTLVVFDLRITRIAIRFHREHRTRAEDGKVDALGEDRYMPIVRSGVEWRMTA